MSTGGGGGPEEPVAPFASGGADALLEALERGQVLDVAKALLDALDAVEREEPPEHSAQTARRIVAHNARQDRQVREFTLCALLQYYTSFNTVEYNILSHQIFDQ